MPATAKKYDTDFEDTPDLITKRNTPKQHATAHRSANVRWNRMAPLVEHFGDAAVAAPNRQPRSRSIPQAPEHSHKNHRPVERSSDIHVAPRRNYRYKPLQFTWPLTALIACTLTLSVLYIGIRIGAQSLSRQNSAALKSIRLSHEAIDNYNKTIAAIQVSPETAQWAIAHGWHLADPSDFDEISHRTSSQEDAP